MLPCHLKGNILGLKLEYCFAILLEDLILHDLFIFYFLDLHWSDWVDHLFHEAVKSVSLSVMFAIS